MGRRSAALLVAASVSLGWALAGPAGAGLQNTILVGPLEGPPGTVVSVQNSPGETCGVAPDPGDAVEVRMLDLTGLEITRARADVAADGAWQLPEGLTVPDGVDTGMYALLATCNPDGGGFDYEAGSFTVTEPQTTDATSLPAGGGPVRRLPRLGDDQRSPPATPRPQPSPRR